MVTCGVSRLANSTINESNHMRCRLRNINNESSTDDPGVRH